MLPGCRRGATGVAADERSTTTYHGVKIVDELRWLENADAPAVQDWVRAQHEKTRAYFDSLPARARIQDRLNRLLTAPNTNYHSLSHRRGRFFLLRSQSIESPPVLITLPSLTNLAAARVIVDPNRLDTNGRITIDGYAVSHDGSRVAVSLSTNGSGIGALHIYDVETGAAHPEIVPHARRPAAGGSVAWNEDGTGFFYTRYPPPEPGSPDGQNCCQQIYFHRVGTPFHEDTHELGRDFPRIARIQLEASPDGRRVLATVARGYAEEYEHHVREPDGRWVQLTRFGDQVRQASFARDPLYIEQGRDDGIYLLSLAGAPLGEIRRLPPGVSDLAASKLIFPQGTNAIERFALSASGIYLIETTDGPTTLKYYDFLTAEWIAPGKFHGDGDLSAIDELVVTEGDETLIRAVSYLDPYVWRRFNPGRDTNTVATLPLRGATPAVFSDVEVKRERVASRDGTLVPLDILRRKGTRLNGNNPTILSRHGPHSRNLVPNFDAARRLWLDHGGVLAVAQWRGDSRTNQLAAFDDFETCARFLIQSNYTRPSRLAIHGTGVGGLAASVLLTRHPDLARAFMVEDGIYDLLRFEHDPGGEFLASAIGTPRDPGPFAALHASSPYHHVTNQIHYPSALLLAGARDGLIDPAHARKMTARLQAASVSGHPTLLQTDMEAGTGSSGDIQRSTDLYSFAAHELGLDYSDIDRGPWSGALTPTSAVVKVKLVREGLKTRLALARDEAMTTPVFTEPVITKTESDNLLAFSLDVLEPATRYHYALEIDGRLDAARRGRFQTLPAPGPASFQIAFASCARTGSTSEVFDRIREHDPLFFLHLGDFHYLDIRQNSRRLFRAAYDRVLASPQQSDLYRSVPFVYMWDDHDMAGNRSDGGDVAQLAAREVYQQYVPHYPLAFDKRGDPLSQSFAVGRVKFILTDLRSHRSNITNRDDARKTMLGSAQKEWFKRELLSANGRYPLILWASTDPWIGAPRTNYYHWVPTNLFGFIHHAQFVGDPHSRTNRSNPVEDDHWSVFRTERREIADFIKTNHIQGVAILHGDAHMLAADDGTHSDYATGGGAPIPVMCAAPLDQNPSIKGGYYSQGIYRVREGEGAFGLLTVTDRGDRIDVVFSGRNSRDEEKISLTFSVPAGPPVSLQ